MTATNEVENYPGFDEVISGFELMDKMQSHALKMGAVLIDDIITDVDFSKSPLVLMGDNGDEYHVDAVIIATGAKARWLEIESEAKYKGRGISACATCDGFFFKNKEVAVIGGGSKALEEAMHLANICSKVNLIHRRDEFRGEKVLQEKVMQNPKITIHYDSVVDEFLGQENPTKLNAIRLKNVKNGSLNEIKVDGAFVAIGSTPNTSVFKGHIELDENGFIKTEGKRTLTNVKGVFSAGDVQDPIYCQAIVAAGSGCMSALDVQEYLMHLK
ncbi:MAG: Thioredoxin reductase [Alphaproteobacteria bacterium ADurb.Bin438]|nr:MAG: Thioredoxin reductase [Alphaproteobacteria bacterium ADurb.Bin438]